MILSHPFSEILQQDSLLNEGNRQAQAAPADDRPDVIAIVGPTASGKTALADMLAVHFNSFVISADAMQVYRGMDIGTAKVASHEHTAPLYGVDLTDVTTPYSAACFQKYARDLIDNNLSSVGSKKRPIVLCGGTGLYINAVIDCMNFPAGKQVYNPVRRYYQVLEKLIGAQGLHQILYSKDPQSAALIHPNNTRRVIRALEMNADGISYAQHLKGLHKHDPYYRSLIFGLSWERDLLYQRINYRVEVMIEKGLFDEVSKLCSHGLESALTALQAIGYKESLAYLNGLISKDEAIELIKRNSRRYAKRQMTWFNRDKRIIWIDATNKPTSKIMHEVLKRSSGYHSS